MVTPITLQPGGELRFERWRDLRSLRETLLRWGLLPVVPPRQLLAGGRIPVKVVTPAEAVIECLCEVLVVEKTRALLRVREPGREVLLEQTAPPHERQELELAPRLALQAGATLSFPDEGDWLAARTVLLSQAGRIARLDDKS
ncbi:MAG: hypothetical protein ACO3JL_20425, partial [Myxococcota bacterium]